MDEYAEANGIRLHYLDRPGSGPVLVLLPGLTANARCFDGLIQAGLTPRFRTLALDLRGRGLSDKPEAGYSIAEHAADVIGLLDSLGLGQVILCGHSFGGLVTLYLAAWFPERVSKLVLLDASGLLVNSTSLQLIKPSLDRLGKTFASWGGYLGLMKRAPSFDGWWDPAIESYYRADVEINEDGSVRPWSRPENILEVVERVQLEDWDSHIAAINQPAILLHASGGYGPPGTSALVPLADAKATTEALANCRCVEVPGNHFTMLYGAGARVIVEQITSFAGNH